MLGRWKLSTSMQLELQREKGALVTGIRQTDRGPERNKQNVPPVQRMTSEVRV
jgi:hypothetical protein